MAKGKNVKENRVLVVVVVFNRLEEAAETIKCLSTQKHQNLDILIVNNSSKENSINRIASLYSNVKVLQSGGNLGYTGGNNLGIEYGMKHDYDYFVFANPDIELKNNVIEDFILLFNNNENLGLAGGKEIEYGTNTVKTVGGKGYNFWRSRLNWLRPGATEIKNVPFEVDYVQGCLVVLRRVVLERGVRFNDDIFAYMDEVDLGFQVKSRGFKVMIDPNIEIEHKAAWSSLNPFEGYLNQKNRWYLVQRWGSFKHILFYFFYTLLFELPIKSILRIVKGKQQYIQAQWAGFIDGIKGIKGVGRGERFAKG